VNPRRRQRPEFAKSIFIDQVPGDWVAVRFGYTRDRCILEHHGKYPASHYLRRWGNPEMVWYRCWPCDVNLNAYDLLKEIIDRSDFEGDLEAETLARAEALFKEWQDVDGWMPDEALFKQGSASWTDLGGGGDPGWTLATKAELESKIRDAQEDPEQLERALQTYRKERKERTYPPSFDSFDEVPAEFIRTEFGWGVEGIFDTFLVPIYSAGGELVSICYMNAWRKWSERGHTPPVFYGLERRRDHTKILVVEGIADTVRLAWEFRDGADTLVVGLESASFDEAKLPVEALGGREVTILGDGGDAGARATAKLVDALSKVASVSVVPLPEGYRDVCAYEGDLRGLVATAEPRSQLHYLEQPEVVRTLEKISAGSTEIELRGFLVALPPLPTDKLDQTLIRRAVATRLQGAGFPVSIADAWVATAAREDPAFEHVTGAVQGREVEPWPEPVQGEELLEDIANLYRRFVFIPNLHAYDLEAAFTVLTYCFRHFMSLPYIHLPSPMPESGKTRNLELLEFCCSRAYIFIDPSASVIFRFVEEFHPTLLLDEVDNIFAGRDEDSKQLKAILNAGYSCFTEVWRGCWQVGEVAPLLTAYLD